MSKPKQQQNSNLLTEIMNDPTKARWVIVVACVLLYAQILWFGLVHLDDYGFVLWGGDLLKLSSIPKFFTHDVFWVLGDRHKFSGFFYRPLQDVAYALCNAISPGHVWVYHAMSLLLHIATSLALFNLFKELGYKVQACLVFALLYAIHPVLTEGVAWIGGVGDQLATLFSLITITYFSKLVKDGANTKYLLIHIAAFISAMFSKEICIGLVPVCLLLFFIFRKGKSINGVIIPAISWLVIVIAYLLARGNAISPTKVNFIMAVLESFRMNVFIVFEYIEKIFLPYRLSPAVSRVDAHFILGAIITIGLIALLVARKRFTALTVFGFVWFLVFLLPAFIELYPTEPFYAFEHRMYLPVIGLLIVVMELMNVNSININTRTYKYGFGIVIAVFFLIGITYGRSYRNPDVFYERAISYSPSSVIMHITRAEVLLDENKYAEGIEAYKKSFEFKKDPATSGKIAYIYQKDLNDPVNAIDWFKITFNLDTNSVPAAVCIADNYMNSIKDTINAEIWYSKALKIDAKNAFALVGNGIININSGHVPMGQGMILQALAIDSTNLTGWMNLSISYYKQGNIAQAIACLNKAYIQAPDDVNVQRNLMICYYRLNNYELTQHFAAIYAQGRNPIPQEIINYLNNKMK